MGCIMTPMPNHLSTLKLHHNRVETTLNPTKNHTKQCGNKEKRKCGNGADEKWCGNRAEREG